ncbi:hypothetical protein V8E54_008294 [Elaphomyces granulatus]
MPSLSSLPELTSRPSSRLSSAPSSAGDYLKAEEAAERRLNAYTPETNQDDTPDFLNIVMKHLPKRGAQNLMDDISSCPNDDDLRLLRLHLIHCLLVPMRALGGKTPGQLTSSPAVDSQFRVECIMSEVSPSSRVEQDELRSKCLRRDNWRCVVTRAVDMFTVLRCPDWPEAEEGINMAATECAHVLPLALAKFDSNRNLEVYNHSLIWEAIYRYFPGVKSLLKSETINSPINAMTLDHGLHLLFGSFRLAFEETSQFGTYRIAYYMKTKNAQWPNAVTLEAHDPSIPLPNPVLLRTHASIAKILNVSGLAKKLDQLIDPPELYSQIHPNGATNLGLILAQRLLQFDY